MADQPNIQSNVTETGQTEYTAGGVTITTGEKNLATQALQAAPVIGAVDKFVDAVGKLGGENGTNQAEMAAVASESAGLAAMCMDAAAIAMDPIGWLVNQGLSFLISVVQPLQDAIHFVSGDGPALKQAAGNFANIGKGVEDLRQKFQQELREFLVEWRGTAAAAAGTKLAEFAKGIDGVAAQAGDVSSILYSSSETMTLIEDFIKALLSEFVTWLIAIWIPALASAAVTFGGSTAAASAATTAKAASTASRTAKVVNKLKRVLEAIWNFIKKVASNLKNLKTGFKNAMEHKRALTRQADDYLSNNPGKFGGRFDGLRHPVQGVRSSEGMVGSRLQDGFSQSMQDVAVQTAAAQGGIPYAGNGTMSATQVPGAMNTALRNESTGQSADSADEIGTDYSTEQTQDYLDI